MRLVDFPVDMLAEEFDTAEAALHAVQEINPNDLLHMTVNRRNKGTGPNSGKVRCFKVVCKSVVYKPDQKMCPFACYLTQQSNANFWKIGVGGEKKYHNHEAMEVVSDGKI